MQTAHKILLPMKQNLDWYKRVLDTSPLAYWPLWELPATPLPTIEDYSGHDYDASPTGITLGEPGIGDGRTSAYFDGSNDFIDIYSTGLRDAINESLFTLMAWVRVYNSAVWTDSTNRTIVQFAVDGTNNFIRIERSNANNTLRAFYYAGGTAKFLSQTSSSTDWLNVLMTINKAGDVFNFYLNGGDVQTTSGLGVWAGDVIEDRTNIGALRETPIQVWSGWIAHVAWWNRILTADEIASVTAL